MLTRMFHIAINSTDLERSVAFYRRLGFQVLADREVHNDQVKAAFAVPTGDLRFVKAVDDGKATTYWVKGGKKTDLVQLDIEKNERMIYKDLGVYAFTGSICENM